MKTQRIARTLAITVAGGLAALACKAVAQESASAPPMPYSVTQVVQLQQAKVGDSAIIAYIQKSGSSYALDAQQIVYLRQQGVSDAVIVAMLNQPRTTFVPASEPLRAAAIAPPAVPVAAASPAPVISSAPAPAVTYAQPPPPPYYYPAPAYYPGYYPYPYYYPRYHYWGPRVGVGIGFGGHGWRVGVRF